LALRPDSRFAREMHSPRRRLGKLQETPILQPTRPATEMSRAARQVLAAARPKREMPQGWH
jgi:hypothetical protein